MKITPIAHRVASPAHTEAPKKAKPALDSFVRDVGIYFHQTLFSFGLFRHLTPIQKGTIERKISLTGAEDITVSPDGKFAIISAYDRHAVRRGENVQGGIYMLDLTKKDAQPQLVTGAFPTKLLPHGISLRQDTDGSFTIHAVNHTDEGEAIEVFRLRNGVATHERTLRDPALIRPNDIAMVDANRFFVTNDRGKNGGSIGEYLGFPHANVVFFDGEKFREVANGIAFANGINYDAKRGLLYVASPREFSVRVYRVGADFSLQLEDLIDVGTGADNIELDENGELWIGAHPKTIDYALWRAGKREKAPSEVIRVRYDGPKKHKVETVLLNDGSLMSASSVAAKVGARLLIGNVSDDHFLVMKLQP